MTSVVPFYHFLGVYVFFWLPCVIGCWVALPLYQVLKLAPTPVVPVIDYCLDFVLLPFFY